MTIETLSLLKGTQLKLYILKQMDRTDNSRRNKMKLKKIIPFLFIGLVLLATVSGSGGNSSEGLPEFNNQPVLRLVDTSKTGTISGSIHNSSFLGNADAIVTVFVFNSESEKFEEVKKIEVSKTQVGNDTEFNLFWLTPEKPYRLKISGISVPYVIGTLSIEEGEVLGLNGGNPI